MENVLSPSFRVDKWSNRLLIALRVPTSCGPPHRHWIRGSAMIWIQLRVLEFQFEAKKGKLAQMGRKVFRFADCQRYSLCREDLPQFLQARLPPCRPFGFAVLWFRVVLRDLHKFDVNASNLKRPAKATARKGKIDLTVAPKRRRVFMIELGWSVENTTQNAQRTHQWDGEAESTPAGNATELNQALKRVKEKDIEKRFHCVFAIMCIVVGKEWNEKYFE